MGNPAHKFFQISTAYCFWSQTTVCVCLFVFLKPDTFEGSTSALLEAESPAPQPEDHLC